MINLDSKILARLDQDELWLLLHLTKRIDKQMICWPSNGTLRRDTRWGMEKLQKIKKQLIDKEIIRVTLRENPRGGMMSNIYQITTDQIGVYLGANQFEFIDSAPPTGKSGTPPEKQGEGVLENQVAPPTGKSGTEVLVNTEVLTIEHTCEVVMGMIVSVKEKHESKTFKPYKVTRARIKLVQQRIADFQKHWPGRDFLRACAYAFEYKAQEWFGSDYYKFFEPETLLGEKFVNYLEKAEQNKGVVAPSSEEKSVPTPRIKWDKLTSTDDTKI